MSTTCHGKKISGASSRTLSSTLSSHGHRIRRLASMFDRIEDLINEADQHSSEDLDHDSNPSQDSDPVLSAEESSALQ